MTNDFRRAYQQTLPVRAADFAGHLLLASLLPGRWWWQFLPDALTAVVWLRSWRSGRLLPATDPMLKLHKRLHAWPVLLPAAVLSWQLVLHWAVHLTLDHFTHRGWRR